ncbi:MAG: hypothetical protein M1839_002906 [Geoglossum umbratile]|nr:MAG: hypothetical protein M1839_002906 [Geoglossum umbratile]
MPPSSVPSENTEELSPLTDENVEVLHLIITTAQSLPQAERFPYRTLFDAYDTVLLQSGLDPDHDQVYFRFLLRLGGVPGDGTLYEKFEALLGQMGIRLEFDMEGDGAQEVTRYDVGRDESRGPVDIPRGRARRASFGSMYDAGDERTQRNGRRTRSHSSLSRPQTSLSTMRDGVISTRATTRATERTLSRDGIESPKGRQTARGRLTSQDFGRNLQHYRKRGRSISSPGILQGWRRTKSRDSLAGRQSVPTPIPNHTTEEAAVTSELSGEEGSRGGRHIPPELLFRPSGTQMSLDAERVYHHHLSSVTVRVLRQWHDMAVRLQYHQRSLDVIATNHDRVILLSQSIDIWRVALQDRKQKAETERFFAHIGRRATKARDLYLVTKAFTHWAQSASDEVERTSVARRHILRIKCFNAWRDITAVNELKVRRQMLKKFYAKWKQSYIGATSTELKAVAVYWGNLAAKMYWAWFWIHKDKQASDFKSGWVKKKYLTLFVTNIRERRGEELRVESVRKREVLRKFLGGWSLKAQALSVLRGEARNFRDRNMERRNFFNWRRQAEFIPAVRQVVFNVEWRISRGAFMIWLQRAKASKRAAEVDRLRILRNAWTNWNDQLRMQTLAMRINERMVLQALYKWVLVERSKLLKRLFEKRLKQATLHRLVEALGRQRTKNQQSERVLRENRERNLMASIFRRWRLQVDSSRQRGRLAFEFHAPRVVQDTIRLWTSELGHIYLLERWAQDAEFYFLTTKTIRFWQKAVTNSKRQKRKIAYGQVRRMVKINLATKMFTFWRERSLQATELRRQAEALDRNRLIRIGIGQINVWRGQLQKTSTMVQQGHITYNTNITRRHLHAWNNNVDRNREMDEKAGYYAQVRALEGAAALLRKWRMRVLGNRGRDMNAQLFKERNDRMRFRNISRYWQNRTAQQRGRRPTDSGTNHSNEDDVEGNDTRRAENWTIFDDGLDFGDWIPGLEASSSSTPMPGYLSTPSKRAARAKALVRLAATPVVFRTPLERRIFPAERDFRRSEFGKSILGKRRGLDERKDMSPPQQPP